MRTVPNYEVADGKLRLYIAHDQPEWCPDLDPGVRVFSIQTDHYARSVGSPHSQHRFREGLVVKDEVPSEALFLMQRGRLDMRPRARLGPRNLASLWMIGFEDEPERSGEITLMEVFGHNVHEDGMVIGRGIKALNDPELVQEFSETKVPIRLEDWHTYSLQWDGDGVSFLIDGEAYDHVRQSPDYPMQFMLNIYELPKDEPDPQAAPGNLDETG